MSSVKQSLQTDRRIIPSLIFLALLIFLLPLKWLIASIIAAIIHELGHYCAVYLSGGNIRRFRLDATGAIMDASGLTPQAEILCLIAGPLAGLLPILLIRQLPTIAICGIIQSAYNLLPIYPLDGGRILQKTILLLGGNYHHFRILEWCIMILLFLVCVYIQHHFGISLFLLIASLLFRKTPCKATQDWI